MRDFPVRPKGTLMSGAFRSSTEAERALRVLRNAGFARAEVVAETEALSGAPIVLRVDAAATGAFRAVEILEEHGAKVRFDSAPPIAPPTAPAVAARAEPVQAAPEPAQSAPVEAGFVTPPGAERKPRVRKRNRLEIQAPAVPLDRADVLIVTRGIESLARSS